MRYAKEIPEMIKDNLFGEEDRKIATFTVGLFTKGPKAMSKKVDKDYRKWFKTLKKGNVITKDMKIAVDEEFDKHSGIEFLMIMMCAKGYVRRVEE